jgi:hypothetical protein
MPRFTFFLQMGSYVHFGAGADAEMHVLIPDGSKGESRAAARSEMHKTCRAAPLPSAVDVRPQNAKGREAYASRPMADSMW